MIETGTRTRNNQLHIEPPQGSITRTLNTDQGLTKQADGSTLTFSAGSTNVSGGNNSLPGFVVNDLIEVTGTNLNNGYFTVTAIDGTNHSFLTLSPPPASEITSLGYVLRSS